MEIGYWGPSLRAQAPAPADGTTTMHPVPSPTIEPTNSRWPGADDGELEPPSEDPLEDPNQSPEQDPEQDPDQILQDPGLPDIGNSSHRADGVDGVFFDGDSFIQCSECCFLTCMHFRLARCVHTPKRNL